MTTKKSFATLLKLRPIEWAPIVAAVLINVTTGLYVMYGINARMESVANTPLTYSRNMATTAPDLSSRIFEAGKIATSSLILFGGGCWLWRANKWIRRRE